ncbi:MAG: M48 family metalloprotease [Rhodocyclaceae bacterium]|nr:M48 family metalloprotease [Rhodocyclaceae bacterium]MDZ4213425.1 M48 family metalloprotease [Rhodocyclaceae bacterium]
MKSAVALAVGSCLLLGGCATSPDSKRTRLVVPRDLGAIYSDVEMQARLAFVSEAPLCQPLDCTATDEFRGRVRRLTERLMPAALQLAREEKTGIPRMTVTVPSKSDIGTMSSASGSIVVFDGLRLLELSDPALAFVIAREIGHVIGEHHEENTATGIAVSVTVALLFPLAGILQGVEAAYAASTLASTATSFAGARVVRAFYEEDQRREADAYALTILTHAGWRAHEVAHAIREATPRLVGAGWMAELRDSQRWLDEIMPTLVVATPAVPSVSEIPYEHYGPVGGAAIQWVQQQGTSGREYQCPGLSYAAIRHAKVDTVKPTSRPVSVKKPGKVSKGKRLLKPKLRSGRTASQRARLH